MIATSKGKTERSKKFVSEYLNKVSQRPYDKDSLIELLRNKLVHNYSISDKEKGDHVKYMLEWQNPRLRLLPDVNDSTRIVINIEGFKNALNNAFLCIRVNYYHSRNIKK